MLEALWGVGSLYQDQDQCVVRAPGGGRHNSKLSPQSTHVYAPETFTRECARGAPHP